MWLWEKIKSLWNRIRNFFRRFIHGVLNFFADIINWFKKLFLVEGNDIPFVVDARSEKFKQMLHEAPTKNVGIFQGNFNQEQDEITDGEYIQADSLDIKTQELLAQEEIVILS